MNMDAFRWQPTDAALVRLCESNLTRTTKRRINGGSWGLPKCAKTEMQFAGAVTCTGRTRNRGACP